MVGSAGPAKQAKNILIELANRGPKTGVISSLSALYSNDSIVL